MESLYIRIVNMNFTRRKMEIFCVDTNKELRNALDTWYLVEEAAEGALVPDFIHGMAAGDLHTYIDVFGRAILSVRLPPGPKTSICHFFISVIQYRRDAEIYMTEYMAYVVCEHMRLENMKGRHFSYIMAKKVLLWLSIIHLKAVVRELRYYVKYEKLNTAIIQTLTEVASLCPKVVILHIVDLLPVMAQLVKDVRDQPTKEMLCRAIRLLSGSVQEYMRDNDSYKVQLMTAMSNIKTNISTWLCDVNVELQEATKIALEPFTAPEPSDDQPNEPHKDDLPTFPHTKLLELYRALTRKEALDAEERQDRMRALVISLVSGREITKDFLHFLLDALKSEAPKETRMTAVMFFSEALKHRGLMKQKDQKIVIQHLLRVIEEDDDILCNVAMEGLGNAVTGAPGLVDRCKNKIIAHMQLRISITNNSKVILTALRALSSIIRRLKLSVLNRRFATICREHMDHPDGQIQITAINLLRDLTESCRLPLFVHFTEEVRSFIPSLLLKLHSDNQEMTAASTSSLKSCLSYIKRSSIRTFFQTEKSLNISDRRSIYSYMARNHPQLTKTLLLQTPDYLVNSEDTEAVVAHIVFLKDAVNHDVLKDVDLYHLSQDLARLNSKGFPMYIRKATEEAVSILATKWFYIGCANKMSGLTD